MHERLEMASALRQRMRALRAGLDPQSQDAATQAVCSRILALDAYQRARVVMAYVSARGELSLAPVIEDVLASGRVLVLPRCEAPGVMRACRVGDLRALRAGAYGLLEPDDSCEAVAPQEIDLILAPGVAFDRRGGRIGQGGGYYDRFLPMTQAARVGVCHDFALLDSLCQQAHDARMQWVITPGESIAVL